MLERIYEIAENINRKWATFVSFFVLIIMVIVLVEVVSRYIFQSPTVWANILATLIFGGYFVMGGAYVLFTNEHIKVDILYNLLPSDRYRGILDLLMYSLFFLFCGVLIQESLSYGINAFLINQRVTAISFQVLYWPTMWCLPIATILLLIAGILKFARIFRDTIKRS